jgi:hypothetical protein
MDCNNRLLVVSEWQLVDFVVLGELDLIVNFVESQLTNWVNKIAFEDVPNTRPDGFDKRVPP